MRVLLNRIDPALFSGMIQSWAATFRPGAPTLVAIDGKTLRGGHNRVNGRAALHPVSAFARRGKLVLARKAVADGACAQTMIPLLRQRLSRRGQIKGALVLINAIACNADTAQAIRDAGADCLLGIKAHQPGLMGETAAVLADPKAEVATTIDADKGHGRVGQRAPRLDRRRPARRRPPLARRIPLPRPSPDRQGGVPDIGQEQDWEKARQTSAIRVCVASRPMTPSTRAGAARSHWAIRNSFHRVPDVSFGTDKARSRTGYGPANMATVRHCAFNILKAVADRQT
jgi:predicted transposase YbfD/YdcC